MASGRQVEYRLNLISNASAVLRADTAAANKFDTSMWQVQKTLASFGVGLGAHFMIDAAKNWTQAAADYESAMLRIKNASKEGFGIFNEGFVNQQVDKFKTKLQETSDAYGNFLFKIKNANLSNDVANRLFENLNVVGKVGGIPQEQMDATVRNVGILLGEGVLEARHLRQLSYVHPQVVPFLADALGLKSGVKDEFSALFKQDISDETAQQKLSQLISSGKLTKLALDARVVLEAFERYRLSIEGKLPETLNTVQSHLNELSNVWERFKNSLVLGQKPELIGFFNDLENGIKWLHEHEDAIVRIGKNVLTATKLYIEWKFAMMAINGLNSIYLSFMEGYAGVTAKTISQTELQTAAFQQQAIALENLVRIQSAYALSTGALSRAQIALLTTNPAASASTGAVAGGLAGRFATGLSTIATPVILTAIIGQALDSLFPSEGKTQAGGVTGFFHPINNIINELESQKRDREMAKKGYTNLGDWEHPDYVLNTYLERLQKHSDLINNVNGKLSQSLHIWYLKSLGLAYDTELGSDQLLKLHSEDYNIGSIPIFNKDGEIIGVQQISKENSKITDENWTRGTDIFGDKNSLGLNQAILNKYGIGDSSNKKKIHLPDDHTKLRGNSSNFFTVNIHGGVNGMVNPKFEKTDSATIQDVKEQVGIEITRNLLEIINDIQVVRNGH